MIVIDNDGTVLFNDAFNTRLYGLQHMVQDHANNERITAALYTDRIVYTTAFVIPVVEH